MEPILLQIPPEIVSQIKLPPKQAPKLLMEKLILRLYGKGIISSGHGAYLLKMNRLSFEHFIAQHHMAIHGDTEELDSDVANIDQIESQES